MPLRFSFVKEKENECKQKESKIEIKRLGKRQVKEICGFSYDLAHTQILIH